MVTIKTRWPTITQLRSPEILKEYQRKPVLACLEVLNVNGVCLIGSRTGWGKCLGIDTPVLMYSGEIMPVQHINAGDLVMGDDNTPRTVLNTVRGIGELFKVVPNKGAEWICNRDHILTLRNTSNPLEIVDISVDDYLKKSAKWKHLFKLFKVGVDYPSRHVEFSPYVYGCWLADGTRYEPSICKASGMISAYINTYFKSIGYRIKEIPVPDRNTTQWFYRFDSSKRNPFKDFVKRSSNGLSKFINNEYLINDRETRMQLLAGLLDCDGSAVMGGFDILTKYKSLQQDICYLAGSLGLSVNWSVCTKRIKSIGFSGTYYRIKMFGDFTGFRFLKHQIPIRKINKNPLNTGFKVESIGVGDFYGFALDKNHRFLLGDFTVNHNTYATLSISKELDLRGVVAICKKANREDWNRAGNDKGVEVRAFGWEEMKTGKTRFGHWDGPNFVWTLPKNVLLCFDEIHRSRTQSTKNAKMVSAAARQNILSVGLSASVGKNPIHMSAIGRWLGLHNGSVDFFRWAAERGVTKFRGELQFDGDEDKVRALHNCIFPRKGIRPEGGDADIQEDVIVCEPVEFGNAHAIQSQYDELRETVAEIKRKEDKAEARGFILAAQTAARRSIELLKLPATVEMAQDLMEEGNSVFLAVNYRESLFWLAEKMNCKCVVYGQGQSDRDRRGSMDSFQRNTSQALIGTIDATKESINLHDVHGGHPRVSLMMPMFSSFSFTQIIGRISRSGNQSPTLQKMLYAAGVPIEVQVCAVLNKSYRQLSILNDGMVDPLLHISAR